MKTLTSLNQVNHLPHSKAVRSALLYELIAPFDCVEKTNDFWASYPTKLFAFLPDEELEELTPSSADILKMFECSEFVTHLYGNWHLALAITSQDGAGCYLLFPYGVNSSLDSLLSSSNTNG